MRPRLQKGTALLSGSSAYERYRRRESVSAVGMTLRLRYGDMGGGLGVGCELCLCIIATLSVVQGTNPCFCEKRSIYMIWGR